MTPKNARLLIPQYLAGELAFGERADFEAEVQASGELRTELAELQAVWEDLGLLPDAEPSAALRARFYQALNAVGRNPQRVAQTGKRPWWQLAGWQQLTAAAALFLGGLYFGQVSHAQRKQDDEMAQMRGQVQSLREMVALSLLDRQSAASRLQGVSWSSRVERPDNELLSALVSAMNGDPNVNVRLSSVDALERYAQDGSVRKALVDSISRQESPLVQIALIDTLVHVRDQGAMAEFKKLSQAQEVNAEVRQRAHWALVRLDQPPGK